MTQKELAEIVGVAYAEHWPDAVVHVRNGLIVRDGPGRSRILCALPNLVSDRQENYQQLAREAIGYIPRRLETAKLQDAEQAKRRAREALERAAPFLLEACRDALFALGRAGANTDNGPFRAEWLACRDAIAKTEVAS